MITISEGKRPIAVIVSILVIACSVVFIVRSMVARRRPIRTPRHEALAARLATETAALINNKGQILLVDVESRQANIAAAVERRAYFIKHIERSGSIKIVAVEHAKPDAPTGHG